MIARVAGENLCPSSASHSSGDGYLSFSIIIVVAPLPTPGEKYTRLSIHTRLLQKMKFTCLLINVGKTKKGLARRVVIFALAGGQVRGWVGEWVFLA